MHNHFASETIWVLALFMRMVPVGASRVCDERVGIRLSRTDRALCNATRSVGELCASLPYAVEMEGCSLIRKSIVHSDNQGVAYITLNSGNGPLAINPYDLSGEAIRSGL